MYRVGDIVRRKCAFRDHLRGDLARVTGHSLTYANSVLVEHIDGRQIVGCWAESSIEHVLPPNPMPRNPRSYFTLSPMSHPVQPKRALPTDSAERKTYPMFSGLVAYFPAALAAVSHHSFVGNEKHNPGQKLQHARGKSGDHEDCIVRHLVDAKEFPAGSPPRIEELTAEAWRSLALLQEELELAGAPAAPAATFPPEN